ncbi:hypothetical protein EON67_05935 [archaeon]|nr:MAG: hypothetical protein EON67_05935 [archaeon]
MHAHSVQHRPTAASTRLRALAHAYGGGCVASLQLHQELAEMLETEEQYAEAIHNFEQAANFFTAENSTGAAQKASVRIAHHCAIMPEPDLRRSAELFERVAGECLSNNLLKFQAKNYLFNAVLCTLARGDVVDAEHNLNKYKDMDYTFPGAFKPRAAAPPASASCGYVRVRCSL